ncbi:GNAT family N-acetyltransferase [Paenibacillus elgii]|nr:GNAT family N-acetyltransferase [Paenibacillus elgii]MCM3267745.1 GNAT family N-acetyltransferase [Paenibacillus elgii]
MSIIQVTSDNIAREHICCAMSDKKTQQGVSLKKDWLACRFQEGLVFKKLDAKGKVFIEYLPAENAWVPIDAPNYTFINCFWVSGSYKGQGYGAQLLQECIRDSEGKAGIVAVSSHKKRPYLSEKSYYVKHGFEVCDTAPPYFELLVKRFDPDAPLPRFKESAKQQTIADDDGLVVLYTDQCPFTDHYTGEELDAIERAYGIPVKRVKLTTKEQAQNAPSAFTTYSAFYNGRFVTHEILTKAKFDKLWNTLGKSQG